MGSVRPQLIPVQRHGMRIVWYGNLPLPKKLCEPCQGLQRDRRGRAYRAGERLYDERRGRHYNFLKKTGVIHSEIMLPEGAPARLSDRATLWNEIEAREQRKDAQLAFEFEFAIPREMTRAQGVALARDFVAEQFVKRGMVADFNVHWDFAPDGSPKPHAHVLLSTRVLGSEWFGLKQKEWDHPSNLLGWRRAWADHVNERLAMLDIDMRIDHRSLKAQGIDLEPQNKIGPAGARRALRGEDADRADDHRRIARENGARIIADPATALYAITRTQATFTTRDLAMFAHRHSDGLVQFDEVMAAVRGSPELVALGKDSRWQDRFTSREMVEIERRLDRASDDLGRGASHRVGSGARDQALRSAAREGLMLSIEQRAALEHITRPAGLSAVVGYAGTGKSAMLSVAREAWEGAGYTVRGAALSGIATRNLEDGSGMASRTIASLEHQWERGRELLTSRDVLVIDEAGMVGTRQMERVMSAARDMGAKVVLVGDPEQLQAIEAGAAFRSLAERHGAVEITEIRRQRTDWQREATRNLATGRTIEAVHAYQHHQMVHMADTRDLARAALIDRWDAERRAAPDRSRIILTHTNAEVHDLNLAARARLQEAGELGDDIVLDVARGSRQFARGDRVMFLKNDRGFGVKNGSLGQVEKVDPARMAVRLDNGPVVDFAVRDYAHLDHGYAATVHKAQGVTVDAAHILATPGLDRHSAYVALSRHRDRLQLHYGRDDFDDQRSLARTLARDRTKDMTSDYAQIYQDELRTFAERRGFSGAGAVLDATNRATGAEGRGRSPVHTAAIHADVVPTWRPGMFDGIRVPRAREADRDRPALKRGSFDGLKLNTSHLSPLPDVPAPAGGADRVLVRTVERISRWTLAIVDARERGLPVLEHQKQALARHLEELDGLRPESSRAFAAVFERHPGLVHEAAAGRTALAIEAIAMEVRARADPKLRADRFVTRWQALERDVRVARRDRNGEGSVEAADTMAGMAKALSQDPQVEAILRGRRKELGLQPHIGKGQDIGADLTRTLDPGREHGLAR